MERLRLVSIVAVLFAFLGSLLMFFVGAAKSVKGFRIYFFQEPLMSNLPPPEHLDFSEQAMIAVLESIDAFLIALVLLLFAAGVYNLFIGRLGRKGDDWPWTRITSVERLKHVLMEVILVVLAVLFLRVVLFLGEGLTWQALVIPLGIALLALALKLVEWRAH